MKINFKQPKYIIPLIILPFLILLFFIMGGKMKAPPAATDVQQEGINTQMPGVDSGIANAQIKDKFEAYRTAFKNARDSSAMGAIGVDAQESGLNYQSVYSQQDLDAMRNQQKIDSMTKALNASQADIQKQMAGIYGNDNGGTGTSSPRPSPSVYQQEIDGYRKWQQENGQSPESGNPNPDSEDAYGKQMKLFKDQMKYIDSMQTANGGGKAQATPNADYTRNGVKKMARRYGQGYCGCRAACGFSRTERRPDFQYAFQCG